MSIHQRIKCRQCGKKTMEITTQKMPESKNLYIREYCMTCKFTNVNFVSTLSRKQERERKE